MESDAGDALLVRLVHTCVQHVRLTRGSSALPKLEAQIARAVQRMVSIHLLKKKPPLKKKVKGANTF